MFFSIGGQYITPLYKAQSCCILKNNPWAARNFEASNENNYDECYWIRLWMIIEWRLMSTIIWVFLQIDRCNPAFLHGRRETQFDILFILSVFIQGQKHAFQLRQLISFYPCWHGTYQHAYTQTSIGRQRSNISMRYIWVFEWTPSEQTSYTSKTYVKHSFSLQFQDTTSAVSYS